MTLWLKALETWLKEFLEVGMVEMEPMEEVRMSGALALWLELLPVQQLLVLLVVGMGVLLLGFGPGGT